MQKMLSVLLIITLCFSQVCFAGLNYQNINEKLFCRTDFETVKFVKNDVAESIENYKRANKSAILAFNYILVLWIIFSWCRSLLCWKV